MPTYQFRNIKTGEEWSDFMSISERDKLLEDKNIEQLVGAPAIISGTGIKTPPGFREVLRRIKKGSPRSFIDPGNISEI